MGIQKTSPSNRLGEGKAWRGLKDGRAGAGSEKSRGKAFKRPRQEWGRRGRAWATSRKRGIMEGKAASHGRACTQCWEVSFYPAENRVRK